MIRRWIVCESGHRWLNALGRFVPELMPRPLVATVTHATPPSTTALLAGQDRSVVLWEVKRDHLALACDWLSVTSIRWPNTLQLVAASGLSDRDLIALLEFNAATIIWHPEQLPSLTTMIHGHFANRA